MMTPLPVRCTLYMYGVSHREGVSTERSVRLVNNSTIPLRGDGTQIVAFSELRVYAHATEQHPTIILVCFVW